MTPSTVMTRCWLGCVALMWGLVALPVLAEKADRNKPMTIDADKPMRLDYERQVYVIAGNVLISQGTLQLRAERVELREGKDGRRNATAIGDTQRPASYRQKLDAPQEWAEATADRIEYDSRTEVLRMTGNATWRRLRANEVADEISGHSIVWDQRTSQVDVSGGVPSVANPGGRVRAVFSPRPESAASAPVGAPTGTPPAASPGTPPAAVPALPLKPSRQLGGESR
ncbi:MAG: lipopolysaccharide transport periplasmic protein LptA [Rubrivivax sp.]|jgi:lipopolysaccharide export system protein LptA|nr:lipopolysaccharide transport periplasmic protein LptA [Rubrivivax sp.]